MITMMEAYGVDSYFWEIKEGFTEEVIFELDLKDETFDNCER